MPFVEQTSSINPRIQQKKDSSQQERRKRRRSGERLEGGIEQERTQIETGDGIQNGHVDYRA
jgi:hypothetical protein